MKEHPYWWDTVAPQARQGSGTPELRRQKYDVAIVGGGYTGLSAARCLARRGASVIVIESGRLGCGASSRNAGQVLTGLKLDPATLIARYGEGRARELFEASLDALDHLEALISSESIQCEYERTGHLQAASKPSHLAALREEQQTLARVFRHQVAVIERREQRSELGSDSYHGLLLDERSGALNPARYVEGLAEAAVRAGATTATGLTVTAISRSANRSVVKTAAGDVDAADVLLATNGYTTGAFPGLQRRLLPIGSYIIATEPLSEETARTLLPRRRMAFDSKHFLHYFRLTADRRLLFGGRAEFTQPRPETTRRAGAILTKALASVFPELAGTGIDYVWGGNVAFTLDQMPRAGRLDDSYYAGGYCGHGIAMATELGELVARRMAGERVVHPLMNDECPRIPLYRGRPWFLPLVGAYYRFRDWRD